MQSPQPNFKVVKQPPKYDNLTDPRKKSPFSSTCRL